MVNTIRKENFLIMCSKIWLNARNSGRFVRLLHISRNYALQTLCGAPHNVCNDEGKINGLPLNRAIRDEDTNEIVDIIAGTFFICDCRKESFGSLSEEQQKRYLEKYRLPERFFRTRDGIEAVSYKPKDRDR